MLAVSQRSCSPSAGLVTTFLWLSPAFTQLTPNLQVFPAWRQVWNSSSLSDSAKSSPPRGLQPHLLSESDFQQSLSLFHIFVPWLLRLSFRVLFIFITFLRWMLLFIHFSIECLIHYFKSKLIPEKVSPLTPPYSKSTFCQTHRVLKW